MSVQKPSLVKLSNDQNYNEIGALFLDSTVYTREEKVELILTKNNKNEPAFATESNSFLAMCLYHYRECGYVPLDLSLQAIKILGEDLGFPHCLHHVKRMMTGDRPMEEKVRLLQVVAEELDDVKHTEVMASLLVRAVLCKYVSLVHVLLKSKSGRQAVSMKHDVISQHCFDVTKSTTAIQTCDEEKYQSFQPSDKTKWTFHRATILEIAIHKKANVEIVRELLAVGGKPLISLSKRSLLQGAILECNNEDAFEIMKCMLKVGGKDLVMVDKSWKIDDRESINVFEFLSIHQRLLFDQECDDVHALNRVYKIMDMLIEFGGKDAILQKNTSGGSILYDFPYYGQTCKKRFVCLVKKMVKIGGMELLRVHDEHGDSILHVLARRQQKVSSFYWELLTKKEHVMNQNAKGQTALHLACENSATIGIRVLLARGDENLARMKDNEGNTALHYLQDDSANFASLKLIIQVGGTNLLHCCNKKEEKAFNLLIQFLEYQEKKLQSVAELEKKVDDLNHKHEEDASQIVELLDVKTAQKKVIDEKNELIEKLQNDAKAKDMKSEKVKAENENSKANESCLLLQALVTKLINCMDDSKNEHTKVTSPIVEFKDVDIAQKNEVDEQKKLILIKKLQDTVKERDIELEKVKANETLLSEQLNEMKEVNRLLESRNEQEKDSTDLHQTEGSSSSKKNVPTSKRSRNCIEESEDTVCKRRKLGTLSNENAQFTETETMDEDLKALNREISKLKRENKDLTNDLKRERISNFRALKQVIEAGHTEM